MTDIETSLDIYRVRELEQLKFNIGVISLLVYPLLDIEEVEVIVENLLDV